MKKYGKYLIIISCIIAFCISICFIPFNVSKLIPIIEEQVAKDLGIKVHIEKLILRFGPEIKIKAPIMHLMYEDGQKFAQFNNVKFYLSWTSILKESPKLNKIYANKLTVRVNSEDRYLNEIFARLQKKGIESTPSLKLKDYHIAFLNKKTDDKYCLKGQHLETLKIRNFNNFKLLTQGEILINSKKYISYDLSVLPKLNFNNELCNFNFYELIEHIKELNFNSDVIADIKLYKNQNNIIQASGFINIDNISVLDVTNKGPKSFVYLTLWGDKASILSNIYTSPNQKVYIEGMINNSKKPVIDLKVKTDEININDLYNKLKIFTDFSILKNINSVTGTLIANFTLKGDLNKIKSNGFFKINDASLLANGIQIERINSEIDFSNNAINIIKTVGYVKNSPIMVKGFVNKEIDIEILMNKVELKHLCPLFIGIKSGIGSLATNITGTLDNIVHKEKLEVENLIIEQKGAKLSLDSMKIDTNKNSIAYIDNIQCDTPETATIKVPSLKIHFDGDNLKIPETDVFMPNSKLTFKSDVSNYNNNNITFNSFISGFVNSNDINKSKVKSTRYPLLININGNKFIQNLYVQALLEKTSVFDEPMLVNLSSKYEKNVFKIEDLSIIPFFDTFSDDLKANIKGNKKIVITGNVENLKKPIIKNLRLFIPQQLNINLMDTLAQIKGDLFINGTFDKPDIVGQINIYNLFNQPTQLSLSGCTIDFNKNIAVINAPLVKIDDNSLGINALISTEFKDKLIVKNVNIKSKFLNTETLLMYKDTPLLKLLPIVVIEGKLYSEKISSSLYNNLIYLSAFSSDFEMNNNILKLKNIASEIFNGNLKGELIFNLRDEHYSSKLMGRGISATPIFDMVSSRKDTVSGIMDFDLNVNGNLVSKKSIVGDIKFIINNGKMSTLGKLEHLLYAQNVIADNMLRTSLSIVTKAITLKNTGLFKYLRGDITLNQGVARINMLQSQGPLMALYIKGLYNIENDFAQLNILGRLSDEVIAGMGAFGDFSLNKLMIMLTGEENKLNVNCEDFEKLPPLQSKNTKEFRSIINGIIDKPSSVVLFNWISYTNKTLRQKDVPMGNIQVPDFVNTLPY